MAKQSNVIMATVTKVTFVDRVANKRYNYGDVHKMSRKNFNRINEGRQFPLLTEGKIDLGVGVCYPCTQKKTT